MTNRRRRHIRKLIRKLETIRDEVEAVQFEEEQDAEKNREKMGLLSNHEESEAKFKALDAAVELMDKALAKMEKSIA